MDSYRRPTLVVLTAVLVGVIGLVEEHDVSDPGLLVAVHPAQLLHLAVQHAR